MKYDPDYENMFCIKGVSYGDQPKVVEFAPEFADTLTSNGKATPWVTDFIDVANGKQTLACLLAPDDTTIEVGHTEGRTCPIVFPQKCLAYSHPSS